MAAEVHLESINKLKKVRALIKQNKWGKVLKQQILEKFTNIYAIISQLPIENISESCQKNCSKKLYH